MKEPLTEDDHLPQTDHSVCSCNAFMTVPHIRSLQCAIPSTDLLRQWASDPEQTQCWGLAAIADRLDRMRRIIDDYVSHQRPACREVPEADAKAGFCYCGLSHAMKDAGL